MTEHLNVNPAACDGVGICAHLAATLIRVDTWGFPIVTKDALGTDNLRQARAAISACPRSALYLSDDKESLR